MRSKNAIECLAETDVSCQILLENWAKVEEINVILKIPFYATIVMQRNNLTMSDQFGCWLRMEWKIESLMESVNLKTELAEILLQKILNRKRILLTNPAFCAAIFLDSRFKFELSQANIYSAKSFLIGLRKKITTTESTFQDENDNSDLEPDDSFEKRLAKRCSQVPVYDKNARSSNVDTAHEALMDDDEFLILLEQYDEKSIRLNHKYSILQYWEENKEQHPELYQLACIVNTIAPTQASVERAFSALNWIYSHKRSRLSPDLLENILLANLNGEMVAKIHQDSLIKAKESDTSNR